MQEMQERWVQSLGQEDPLGKEMATHSSILAWKIPWTEEPGGQQSLGLQRVGYDRATEWLSAANYFHLEGQTAFTALTKRKQCRTFTCWPGISCPCCSPTEITISQNSTISRGHSGTMMEQDKTWMWSKPLNARSSPLLANMSDSCFCTNYSLSFSPVCPPYGWDLLTALILESSLLPASTHSRVNSQVLKLSPEPPNESPSSQPLPPAAGPQPPEHQQSLRLSGCSGWAAALLPHLYAGTEVLGRQGCNIFWPLTSHKNERTKNQLMQQGCLK